MTTRNHGLLAYVVLATVALGAASCQNKAKPKTVPEAPHAAATEAPANPAPATPPPAAAEPFPSGAVDKSNVVEPSIAELTAQGVLRTVYFGYNSNELDDAGRATLQANAAWMTAHKGHRVEIGGHCDERGSIGYNVALGDRRAASVKTYLTGSGVGTGQLVTISYGEEKPAVQGHDEAAWAKNRRAEFLIKP
jgi:peptidoglycan-associated lipoprotein